MSSPAVQLYAWIRNNSPTYYNDGCELKFRYAEIINTTLRANSQKVMLEFETSVPFTNPTKDFANSLISQWIVKTGLFITLFYAYSNNRNRYTVVVNVRVAPPPQRRRQRGKVHHNDSKKIEFVKSTATTSSSQQTPPPDEDVNSLSEIESQSEADSGVIDDDHHHADEGEFTVVKFNGRKMIRPKIRTSIATSTEPCVVNTHTDEVKQKSYAQAVGCNIGLDYNSDDFKDKIAISAFSRNDVFERARLQLSFFRYERDINVNLMSYVSNKIYMINAGIAAQDDSRLEYLYFKFCEEKGLTRKEIEDDLINTSHAIRTKRLNYLNAARKNFFEFYGTDPSRSKVIVRQPHTPPLGRCDPTECILM